MATSEVSICNMAIASLGGTPITSLEYTESATPETILCSTHYEASRDAVLEEREWAFAMRRAKLNKLADAPIGYDAAFQLPSDLLRVIKVGTDPEFLGLVYDWVREGSQILINSGQVYIRYIIRCVDPSRFSSGFVQALSARIAADICVGLTNNPELFAHYWQLYLNKLTSGATVDGQQGANQLFRTPLLTTLTR